MNSFEAEMQRRIRESEDSSVMLFHEVGLSSTADQDTPHLSAVGFLYDYQCIRNELQ